MRFRRLFGRSSHNNEQNGENLQIDWNVNGIMEYGGAYSRNSTRTTSVRNSYRKPLSIVSEAMDNGYDHDQHDDVYGNDDESPEFQEFDKTTNCSSPCNQKNITISIETWKTLQQQMKVLEDYSKKQSAKQFYIEDAIKTEVELRTKKVLRAMEEKLSLVERNKQKDIERETQLRVAARWKKLLESQENGRPTDTFKSMATALASKSAAKEERVTKQSKRRKRDRWFRSTSGNKASSTGCNNTAGNDMSAIVNNVSDSATELLESVEGSRGNAIPEHGAIERQHDLEETIRVLKIHIALQEKQLDQAKKLISEAIATKDDLEKQLFEAMEISVDLDERLENATKDLEVIRTRQTCPDMPYAEDALFSEIRVTTPRSYSEHY